VIFGEGDSADGFHVVRSGRVKVYRLSGDGREQILHIWGAGEPFGEVAVFVGGVFPAHAEAIDDCRTIYVPRAGLIDLLRRDPDLALAWLGVLSIRLRRFADMVEALTLKEAPARLASYLLLVADRQGGAEKIELDITKGQLANLLGATPETLSRVLTRMTGEGFVEAIGPRGLRVLDRAALEDLAAGARRLPG
jgi:CRP/FNR family transcriptional regulator